MAHHTAREIHEGSGQTGRLGEIFIALGLFIVVYGLALWALTHSAVVQNSPVGGVRAAHDMFPVWFFYVVMGIGFSVFGTMAVLAGWGRHHVDAEW